MKMMKKSVALFVAVAMVIGSFSACGKDNAKDEKKAEITIAYEPSVSCAPLAVVKEQGLIEKAYDGNITVNWTEMANGSEISEGLTTGALDVGCLGISVAFAGMKAGSPYKIAFGISAQPYAIQTNDPEINSLKDIKASDQIAITNINSLPHILLAMWAKNELGDAHALDKNLTVLNNTDGYTSIVSGAVSCHMVISPFNFMETSNKDTEIHEIPVDNSVWADDNTEMVAVATERFKNDDPEAYDALVKAVEQANEYIKGHEAEVAEIVSKKYDASADEIREWIQDPRTSYNTTLKGAMQMAEFMKKEGFIEEAPESMDEIAFDNVKGN